MQFGEVAISSGTGFVVNSVRGPVLLTNRHNVTGRHQDTDAPLSSTGAIPDNILIAHRSRRLGGVVVIDDGDRYPDTVFRRQELYEPGSEKPLWLEHPVLGRNADFVALPLTQLEGVDLLPYDLGETFPRCHVGPASTVSVVGFPFAIPIGPFTAIWATGFVASEMDFDYGNLPLFLIDCRSRPGQSGSAVIAHQSGGMHLCEMPDGTLQNMVVDGTTSRFLGIYSGRINNESDLGKVWKVSAIKELVDSIR